MSQDPPWTPTPLALRLHQHLVPLDVHQTSDPEDAFQNGSRAPHLHGGAAVLQVQLGLSDSSLLGQCTNLVAPLSIVKSSTAHMVFRPHCSGLSSGTFEVSTTSRCMSPAARGRQREQHAQAQQKKLCHCSTKWPSGVPGARIKSRTFQEAGLKEAQSLTQQGPPRRWSGVSPLHAPSGPAQWPPVKRRLGQGSAMPAPPMHRRLRKCGQCSSGSYEHFIRTCHNPICGLLNY